MDHNAQPFVEKVTSDYRDVENSREPIELSNILKFEGLVGSGAKAKMVVAAGQVLLNGQVETPQCKTIMAGDTIEFAGQKIEFTSQHRVAMRIMTSQEHRYDE